MLKKIEEMQRELEAMKEEAVKESKNLLEINLEEYDIETLEKLGYKIREEVRKRKEKEVADHIEVIEIPDEEQFKRETKQPKLNKQDRIGDYYRQLDNPEEYDIRLSKASKKVVFTNYDKLQDFNEMLLSDFEFIKGTGGSTSDDKRLEKYDNVWEIPEEIFKDIEWYAANTIEVYYKDQYQYTIDAQGYSYARYLMF